MYKYYVFKWKEHSLVFLSDKRMFLDFLFLSLQNDKRYFEEVLFFTVLQWVEGKITVFIARNYVRELICILLFQFSGNFYSCPTLSEFTTTAK